MEEGTSENTDRIVYVDCSGNDELFGEKLQSIVAYAMSTMGVGKSEDSDQSSGITSWVTSVWGKDKKDNAELNFSRYCEGLGSKLGPYEPYSRNVRLVSKSKQKICDDMKALLPRKQPEFEIIICRAAEQTAEAFEMPITELSKWFYNSASKELILSQFVVFKIFRAGDNLEISPCLLKVKSKREQGNVAFNSFSWAQCEVDMHYEERKYVLNKFMIKQIIKKLAEKDYGF